MGDSPDVTPNTLQTAADAVRSNGYIAQTQDLLVSALGGAMPGLLYAAISILALIMLYRISKNLVIRAMKEVDRSEAQILQFTSMWKYAFFLTGIVLCIVSMSGSFAAMGLTVAFLGMVLGWSLRRPMTGVAAWVMVMVSRPFRIGDRIVIMGARGEVLDISLTHILLSEVGGEESSNRDILIPNSVLFEQMVINYAVSKETKYVQDEVPVRVSYDSDYRLAESTLISCAREVTKDIVEELGREPDITAEFVDSGILMQLRYQSIAVERQKISTAIVAKIADAFSRSDRLGFAPQPKAVRDSG